MLIFQYLSHIYSITINQQYTQKRRIVFAKALYFRQYVKKVYVNEIIGTANNNKHIPHFFKINYQLGSRRYQQAIPLNPQPIAKIIFSMSTQFLLKFFQLTLPAPGKIYPGGSDAKSDLKLILQIATNSRLKQGQDKKSQNKQIFYCRSLGKDCFKIEVEFFIDGSYKVIDDYIKMRHREGCEKCGQTPAVIRIYNLMMLKRGLIEQFMNQNNLCDFSPESILQRISGDKGQYFYCEYVPDLENRRKLKKRFDNIINISIKKKKSNKLEHVRSSIEKIEAFSPRGRSKKPKKSENNKENNEIERYLTNTKDVSIFGAEKLNEQELSFGKPHKRVKMQSNSSIYGIKNEHEEGRNLSMFSQIKIDSMFEQEEDYFKKKSDINIALNMNDLGSHNFWPESDNSIGQINSFGDRSRKDDIFSSFRNSLLLRSLEKKSLGEINYNIEGLPFSNSDGVERA